MNLIPLNTIESVNHIIKHAHELCLEYDPNSDCKKYLIDKINLNNTNSFYSTKNNIICGLAIIEIVDKHYGNLIIHCIDREHEAEMAKLLGHIIKKNILELIQFRSNFNYRDAFLEIGYREKERARMIHHDIGKFIETTPIANTMLSPIQNSDKEICGHISFNAHKHRQHIEHYDVYSTATKRSQFAEALRSKKHGTPIDSASLLLKYNNQTIGLIEVVDVMYFNEPIGWIMDVAILPEFQGMGLGQYLIKSSLGEAYKSGYSKVGLGVTLSNRSAYQLYQNLGFEEYEIFVEIIGL